MEYLVGLLSDGVNPWVFGFFLLGALLLLYIASFYLRQSKDQSIVAFGLGLGFTGIAFLYWSYVTGFHPDNLGVFTLIGVLFFIVALISFFVSYIVTLQPGVARTTYVAVGVAVFVALVGLRLVFYQSDPGFSDEGFFSFNIDQIVVYAYVIALAYSVTPAAYAVAGRVKNDLLAAAVRLGLTLTIIGTAILITSPDNYLQMINGVGMIAGFIVLAVAHSFIPLKMK